MTHKEVYVCDVCGAEYGNPDDAEQCEKKHKKVEYIRPIVFNKSGKYPLVMSVRFEDGVKLRYNYDPDCATTSE